MLKTLSVRDVVLIDKLNLDFSDGLSVFSGETGAGKSILLDSLGLLLGNRAETSLIRTGAEKLSVSGVFEIKDKNNPFFALCKENELDVDDEIIIKRILSRDGKGKIFLNDQPITARLLKELGACLVEIHGQFDNQGLLNPATHLTVLDLYGGYVKNLEQTAATYQKYKTLQKQLMAAEQAYADAAKEEDNLRHWADELEKAKIKPGEEDELNRKRTELMHAEKLIENLNLAYNSLQGRDISNLIRKAQSALEKVNHLTENRFADIGEALDTALIQLDEAVSRIEEASSEINLNANEADAVEERLFALKALARKHACTIDSLPEVLKDFKNRLTALDKGGENIADLRRAVAAARREYMTQAEELSKLRTRTAATLDKAVMKELPPLKMERAVFATEITQLPENEWSGKGFDKVNFTVSTNPNSPRGALNKIASGGELSRFMLALKVNLSQKSSVETLIFDEVDAGIGGATAQAVGERLARLAGKVQVLVVTHSPQVASFSRRHFMVSKTTVDNVTTTKVHQLSAAEKKEEIARMLSGENITDEARAAADVLINGKKTQKNKASPSEETGLLF